MRERNNFVQALRDPAPRLEIVEVQRELPAPPQTVLLPHTGYEHRAKGFSLATALLAGVAGLVAALVGILGWQVSLASFILPSEQQGAYFSLAHRPDSQNTPYQVRQ
jgi:hypothetical protein